MITPRQQKLSYLCKVERDSRIGNPVLMDAAATAKEILFFELPSQFYRARGCCPAFRHSKALGRIVEGFFILVWGT